MELNHLKYFYVVAKEGGFSHAAKVLHVAQPAISKMVKNLELSMGVELFERVGRNVRMTKIGNDVFRRCELIFGHVEEIQNLNDGGRTEIKGPLNLCAVDVVASHLLPGVLKTMLEHHPLIYPQVTSTTAGDACQYVLNKKADSALLFHAPDLPRGLEVRHVYPLAFRLVVAAKHRRSTAVCSSFIGSREIDDVANKTYPALSKLRKHYPDAQIVASANALNAHREMVLAGMGVSILPHFLVAKDIAGGEMSCLLKNESFVFHLKLIARAGEPPTNPMRAFLDVFTPPSRT